MAAQVTITVPWSAQEEGSGDAADVDDFGVIDNDDTRDLLAAAASNPHTRWCVTTLNPDGTAAAHGCITGRHPPPGFAAGRSPRRQASPGPDPPLGPRPQDWLRERQVRLTPITQGHCDHEHGETGYRPAANSST